MERKLARRYGPVRRLPAGRTRLLCRAEVFIANRQILILLAADHTVVCTELSEHRVAITGIGSPVVTPGIKIQAGPGASGHRSVQHRTARPQMWLGLLEHFEDATFVTVASRAGIAITIACRGRSRKI
jgi:hypothetical protein